VKGSGNEMGTGLRQYRRFCETSGKSVIYTERCFDGYGSYLDQVVPDYQAYELPVSHV
jgi:hypothetical protein